LPVVGSNPGGILLVAIGFVTLGAMTLAVARRRASRG
jgi:hypothetical protein